MDGVVCTGLMGDGADSGSFLVKAGIASENDVEAVKKHRFGPCLVIPSLKEAWKRTNAFMDRLPEGDRNAFRKHIGR
jgi:hypothetical protein